MKPPYRVPTMAEIAAVEPNGLNAISSFSGGGGSTTGLKMAGFNVIYAIEFIPAAAACYRINHPATILDDRDVREVTAAQILERTGLDKGDLDLFDGSPPCEPFSSAGKRDKTWGEVRDYSGREQRSDDLFFEYIRLLRGLRPRAFIAENVAGLVRGRAKGYYKRIHAELVKAGYRVEGRLLDAQWLGVPQTRERLILVGVRKDLRRKPPFPHPLDHRYTVRDALPELFALPDRHVVRDTGRPQRPRELGRQVDGEPAPTIVVGDRAASGQRHIKVDEPEPRVEHDTKGAHSPNGARDITDGPSPAVCAGGGNHPGSPAQHFKVVQDTRRGKPSETDRDITDEPSPAVLATGGEKQPPVHVEIVSPPGAGGEHDERELDGDEPCHAITASGAKAPLEVHDEPSVHFDLHNVKNGKQRRNITDRPSTTVGADASSRQLDVEEPFDEMVVGNDAFEPRYGPPDRPSPTIVSSEPQADRTAGAVRNSRTRYRRKLTIDELKRICGFPDDYQLVGSYSQQWERLGDAVPPPMMAQIAAPVRDLLKALDGE